MKLIPFLSLLCVLSTSCKMMENAEQAAKNSGRAADNSDTLRDLSTSLYMSALSGGSEDSRREALKMMEESESFDLKARYAASFIKSQTYQLINPMLKNISVGDFNRFFNDALLEDIPIVARAIAENMPKGGQFKVTKTKGTDGNVKAIAVALHETNKLYYQFSGVENIKMLSILDVVMDALRAHYVEKKSLSQLTEVQKKVLYYRREFLYAIELRHKFLPLVAVAKVSELNSSTVAKIRMLLGSWSPVVGAEDATEAEYNAAIAQAAQTEEATLTEKEKKKRAREIKKLEKEYAKQERKKSKQTVAEEFSPAEFEMALKVLKQSVAARDFLEEIGTSTKELPAIVHRLLNNLDLKETASRSQEPVVADLEHVVAELLNQ